MMIRLQAFGRLRGEAHGVELLDDGCEKRRRHREVEQDVPGQVPGLLRIGNLRGEMLECLDRLEIALNVIAAIGKVVPFLVVDRPGCELLDVFGNRLPIHLVVAVRSRDTDDGKIGRKQLQGLEIVKSRQELSFGEVAGCTENDYGARVAGTFVAGQRLFGHCRLH